MQRMFVAVALLVAVGLPIGLSMSITSDMNAKLGYSTRRKSVRYDVPLKSSSSKKKVVAASSKPTRKTFVIDQEGFPVTQDPLFNKCFRASYGKNELTIADLRANVAQENEKYADSLTRKSNAAAKDCASYHPFSGDRWSIPGETVTFTYDPAKKKYTLPANFYLKREVVEKPATGSGTSL